MHTQILIMYPILSPCSAAYLATVDATIHPTIGTAQFTSFSSTVDAANGTTNRSPYGTANNTTFRTTFNATFYSTNDATNGTT